MGVLIERGEKAWSLRKSLKSMKLWVEFDKHGAREKIEKNES